jgi:hypothetical protein
MKNEEELYYCGACDYTCYKKSEWTRHLSTSKHLKKDTDGKEYICQCGRSYKFKSGLSRHKKAVNCFNELVTQDNPSNYQHMLTNLVLEVVKQNKELITQNNEVQRHNQHLTNKLVEISKTTNNISINNSNNKTFNLNLFLNEQCKDAMNLMDFVDSLELQLSDLESIGKLGFVEGISNIIVKNLKALDIYRRPVHCSDTKREIIYVKDDNKWERENEDKMRLRKAIKRIATKNSCLLPDFKMKYPECAKASSPLSDQYNKLIVEAMGGSGNNDHDNENKIIKKIAREFAINKTM